MTKIFLVKEDNNRIESKMFYSLEAARKYFLIMLKMQDLIVFH